MLPNPARPVAAGSGRTQLSAEAACQTGPSAPLRTLLHNALPGNGQTSLNGGTTELLLPTALAAWWRCPNHLQTKPDRQRPTPLQAVIVRRPILGLVLRRGPTAHRPQLSRWIHAVNPRRPFVQQSRKHRHRANRCNDAQHQPVSQSARQLKVKVIKRIKPPLRPHAKPSRINPIKLLGASVV